MKARIAINGFGRIGRLVFREMFDKDEFEIVAINGRAEGHPLAYLLKYDTAHGRYKADSIESTADSITVDGKKIVVCNANDPEELPWKELNIDIVIEATGKFRTEEGARKHIKAGAKKVIITAPAKGDIKQIVYNVNDDILEEDDEIVSGASCTTNCLAPVAKVLNDEFKIVKGLMTTIHAYTNDQKTLDGKHKKDLRRGRTAAMNIVPTTTGAAVAVGKVLPELKGKLDGKAMRVPTMTGSLVDLTVELEKKVTVEEINNVMKKAKSETLGYTEDEIVSSDIIGLREGSLFDSKLTTVMEEGDKQLVNIVAWYDNEMSYTCQLVRLVKKVASML